MTVLAVFRNSRERPFEEELRELISALPTVDLHVWHSQPLPEEREGIDFDSVGRMSFDQVEVPVDDRPLVYLCGAAGLMDQATETLVAQGVPRFDIFREDFHSTVEVPKDLAPATIQFGSGAEPIAWEPADGTILSAADRQGRRLPSGCRVGQCESCAVRVLAGSVAHLGEAPADDACLTCIAVPIGDVTLDV